jgi:exonuclease III
MANSINRKKCHHCIKTIFQHNRYVTCSLCSSYYHQNCLPNYSPTDIEYAINNNNHWSCPICLQANFPFNIIEDNSQFYEQIRNLSTTRLDPDALTDLIYNPFDNNEDNCEGSFNDIDPDQNFLNEMGGKTIQNCKYHYIDSPFTEIKDKLANTSISLMHLNIRSLPKNLNDFSSLLDTSTIDFNLIALSETWLHQDNADSYGLKGFKHEYLTRKDKKGGGVSIFIKDSLNYKSRTDLNYMSNSTEMLWIELEAASINNPTNLILGVIYRVPGTDVSEFNNILSDTLTKISNENKSCLHTGDYNINLLNAETHLPTSQFVENNFTNSFLPNINRPTRITSSTASLIDNIFTNFTDTPDIYSAIIISDLSDHFPVIFLRFNQAKCNHDEYITYRSNSNANKVKFTKKLEELDFKPILEDLDTQRSYTTFHQNLTSIYNASFPIKKMKIGYTTKLSWLTLGLRKSISLKHKLHILYLKTPSSENLCKYKKFKNKLGHVLKVAERLHYQTELVKHCNNMRKSWATIKDIINKNKKKTHKITKLTINGNPVDDSQEIADNFCKFFTNIGPILDSKIPKTNIDPINFIPKNYTINLFLQPVTSIEIDKIVDNLKNCALGWDQFPSAIFKENKNILSPILTHIINLSFSQGIFPSELKIGNIIPIFKAGDSDSIGNYRPVSLLSTVSKVFERAFYKRLASFMTTQKILYELQFGFREKHSTQMAIIKLLDDIIYSLNRGEYAAGIFLDFSKAFDTVNHNILLKKLDHYGVRGIPNNWVRSYLTNRTQFCTYDGKSSNTSNITCGVPQGSILGPLLFLIYVNDLGHIFNTAKAIIFADDTNLISKASSLETLEQSINKEIPTLVSWLHTNRLSLNLKKTHIMLFGQKNKKTTTNINIFIGGVKIDTVQHTKFLGIILDSALNWKNHIAHISTKIAKSIGIISRARQLLNPAILRQLYYSFLYPYLTYCLIIWGSATESTLLPIFRLQKRAIRLIKNLRRRDSTLPTCHKLKILRLPELYNYLVLLWMYDYKSGLLPSTFDHFYQTNSNVHSYPTRRAEQLRPPQARTKLAQTFIRTHGALIWNKYSSELNIQLSKNIFKKEACKILISDYIQLST